MKLVHGHALPENTRYRDSGCYLYPSCLECPREVCVYDVPERVQTRSERDHEIVRLRKEGVPATELARAFNISRRVVLRVIQRGGPSEQSRQLSLDDVQGKPTSAIGSPIHAPKPYPVMRENRRAN